MDFRHSRRFASEQAKIVCGDLYPGPILMPRGLLRALDPIIAVALGPANSPTAEFHDSFEQMLRGRPDGPLLLALWASTTSGEIPHADLRKILKYFPDQLPERPINRGELLAFLHPRVSIIACCTLSLAERRDADALPAAERLGLGLVITKLLIDLPQHLAAGKLYFPQSALQQANLKEEDLFNMVRTPKVDQFLATQCDWALALIEEGLPACDKVGARLRRGLLAAALRAQMILRRVRNPQNDIFRRPPQLSAHERWRCAMKAWRP